VTIFIHSGCAMPFAIFHDIPHCLLRYSRLLFVDTANC
jgi:hypothetical protein